MHGVQHHIPRSDIHEADTALSPKRPDADDQVHGLPVHAPMHHASMEPPSQGGMESLSDTIIDFRRWMQHPDRDGDWLDAYIHTMDPSRMAMRDVMIDAIDTHPSDPGQPWGTLLGIVQGFANDEHLRQGMTYYLHRAATGKPIPIAMSFFLNRTGDGRSAIAFLTAAPLANMEQASPDMTAMLIAVILDRTCPHDIPSSKN
jgi:hypothetical protein